MPAGCRQPELPGWRGGWLSSTGAAGLACRPAGGQPELPGWRGGRMVGYTEGWAAMGRPAGAAATGLLALTGLTAGGNGVIGGRLGWGIGMELGTAMAMAISGEGAEW